MKEQEGAQDAPVLIDKADGVATVRLNNPARRNSLTPNSCDLLVGLLNDLDDDPSIGAVVIQGEGGTFCSGADLSDLGSAMDDPTSDASYRAIDRIYRAFTRFGELSVPTIAAVRGAAVGAGMNLALTADVRVVSSDARLISGFGKIGLHPGGGHLQLLVRAAGREAAAAMAVLSQEVKGDQAVARGLAWAAVEDDEVERCAHELATNAARDPDLSRRMIQTLRSTDPPIVPAVTALQAERAVQLWSLRRAAVRREAGSR